MLAEAEWRLARVRRAETAFFDQCIETLMTANPDLYPDQAMAQIFIDPEYRKRMSLFLRYQTSIERAPSARPAKPSRNRSTPASPTKPATPNSTAA